MVIAERDRRVLGHLRLAGKGCRAGGFPPGLWNPAGLVVSGRLPGLIPRGQDGFEPGLSASWTAAPTVEMPVTISSQWCGVAVRGWYTFRCWRPACRWPRSTRRGRLDRFHQNHATAPTATTATMIHWPRDNPSVFPRGELEGAGGGAALAKVALLTRR